MKLTEQSVNINPDEIVKVLCTALRMIDERLVEHGERVSYIVHRLYQRGNLSDKMNWNKLFLLSAFHDISAYKTEEIDRMLQFESTDVWSHSIYGYCFLKNMTPLGDYAEAILYHHLPYPLLLEKHSEYQEYAALISIADRIDVLIQTDGTSSSQTYLQALDDGRFSPEYIELFAAVNADNSLRDELVSGKFRKTVEGLVYQNHFISMNDAMDYLKMLIYSVDFRSDHTVTHTINTTAVSVNLARRLNFPQSELNKIYLGALLHDIGKIGIPLDILESPGRLSPEQMDVMRTHVTMTESIIHGLVDDELCQIAVRHHEKLDGSGYPRGLTGDELSVPQRIVAIADIVSALTGTRSYKEPFPKEKTIQILSEMKNSNQLDAKICDIVIDNFDEIMEQTDMSRDLIIGMYRDVLNEYNQLVNKLA